MEMDMEEIDLRELLHILLKRIWIIAAVTVLSIAVSGVVSFFVLEPEYETFTTLMVGKPSENAGAAASMGMAQMGLNYNDLMLNRSLVSTYGELAKSRKVSNEVIKNLKLKMTPNEFGDKVNVSLLKDTEIIKISVTDTDKELAVKIANETGEVLMSNIGKIMLIENIQVIDKAEVPKNPIAPRPMLNMAIAGVLGFMVSIFAVFLMEYLDNTVKTTDDIEKHLGLPVIGMIPINEGSK